KASKVVVPALIAALDERDLEESAVIALIRLGPEAKPAVPALSKRLRPAKPYWLELVGVLTEGDPRAAKVAICDLRSVASSKPVRDQGIVNFRRDQQRIARAKKLLKKLESLDDK